MSRKERTWLGVMKNVKARALSLVAATALFTCGDAAMKLVSNSLPTGETIFLRGVSTVALVTIAAMQDGVVKVAIIPHTWEATNLHARQPGDRINVECDMIAKHVDRLLSLTQTTVHRD